MENVVDKTIIIPDVHCRNFYKPALEIKDSKIVFLGDYMDPYPQEGFSSENGLANLEEIIDFKKANPDRVTLLIGNHDINYFWQQNWASRYNRFLSTDIHHLFDENLELFEIYKVLDGVLFTHAGVSKGWCDYCDIKDPIKSIDEYWKEFLKDPFNESNLPLFDCGYARWGAQPYGGPFWNDLNEYKEENPVGFIQIAGHNQLKATGSIFKLNDYIQIKGKPICCCDSRAIFVYENETLKKYEN